MSFLNKALKSGIAVKAARMAQREMSKLENQRKAKELLGRLTRRGGSTGPTGRR